jgi:predicted RNA-binding Zn ribbon-like protein
MNGRRPAPGDLAVLNAELRTARRRERLVAAPDRLRWTEDDAPFRLERVLGLVSTAAARLLTSDERVRLRECPGDGCGWLFLDRSRNRSRQWRTMEDCGNVSKVRRFRARNRSVRKVTAAAGRGEEVR